MNDTASVMVAKGFLVCAMFVGASLAAPIAHGQTRNTESPNYRQIKMRVPAALQKYLCKEIGELAAAVYPQADATLIQADMKAALLQDEQVFDVSKAQGITRFINDGPQSGIHCAFDIPLDRISVGTWGMPAGSKPRKESLSEEQARAISEDVVRRVIGASELNRLAPPSVRLSEGRYICNWLPKEGAEAGAVSRILVAVRKNDGVIQEVGKWLQKPPSDPKVTRDAMIKKAAAAIKDFQPARLTRRTYKYFTSTADVWHYEVPPGTYGEPKDRTLWSADTGALLYSEVIGGGTQAKPYRDPEFYFEPTESALRSRLRQLLEDAAKEADNTRRGTGTQPT